MSETSRLVQASVDGFLDRHLASAGLPAGKEFVDAFEQSGLALVMAPEAANGLAGGLADAAVIAETWGVRAAPLPIVELIIAGSMTGELDQLGEDVRLGLCTQILSCKSGRAETDRAIDAAGPPDPTHFLFCTDGREPFVAAVKTDQAETWASIDGSERFRLAPDIFSSAPCCRLSGQPELFTVAGPLLTVAAMTGAMAHIVELAIDYAQTRKQFGRPIGKFQAVQSLLAASCSELAVTRAALEDCLGRHEAGRLRALDIAVTKAQAGRAAGLVARNAHQVFAAIGFSQDHELHHYTKRLWLWSDLWGRQAEMEERVGRAACEAGSAELWTTIVGSA